jgi:transcription antitermination factor NusG
MEGWYIAKVKPQKEGALTSFLGQWGIEVFYPKIVLPGRNSGRKALFPSYVFCRLDPQSGVWPVARWAPGISYFLNHDGEPTPFPEIMVQGLKQRVADWNEPGGDRRLHRGSQVVILSGPFSGLEGIFQRYVPGRKRCQILLDAVGRFGTVELSEREVTARGAEETCQKGIAQ